MSHGEDYTRFFRSMGDARVYVAEIANEIVGSLTVVGRHILLADGTSIPAAYLGDAKVVKKFRGRTVLARLSMAARDQILAAGYKAAFSVVMTGSTPSDRLTGRLGIPKFDELGYPGLFTALPAGHPFVGFVLDASGGTASTAGASVYGTGLPSGEWMMNTSEI